MSLAWRERGIGLLLLASAGLLLAPPTGLGPTTLLALWALWLFAVVAAQRWGVLHVFGPVLFYDMVRTARRNRYALLRCLYAGFLFVLLFSIYTDVAETRPDSPHFASRLAADFFQWFIIVQLCAVMLLTPAYVGGAVADEKERHTLEFLLATDLRNQEIVLSKLGSRLANLALFLLTGLPILSLLQFLGGIDPNLVLMGFAVTGLTMLGMGSISLFYSVMMRRPRDAIGLSYLFSIVYFAVATTALGMRMASHRLMEYPIWFGADPPTVSTLTAVVNAGNPLAVIIKIGEAGRTEALATVLPAVLRDYATFHLVLAAVCIGLSILRLRAVGLKQTVGREVRHKDARGERVPIGEMPMLWKETLDGRVRLGWSAWLTILPLGLLILGIGLWICGDYLLEHLYDVVNGNWTRLHSIFSPELGLSRSMNIWARIAGSGVACVTILWAAVRAATSISGERDKQTLDALITTQLGSDAILGSKLLGSLLGVRLGLVCLGLVLALACVTGGVHPIALPLTLAAWLVYACFFTMLGLWFSMTCSTTTRATVTTVMVSMFLGAGHWLCWICLVPLGIYGHAADSFAEFLRKFEIGLTPPVVLGVFMYTYDDLARDYNREFLEILGYCIMGLGLWGVATLGLWYGLLSPRFREIMRREHSYPE